MSFVFPWLLWALPLAAAPLALHLLSRRRARRKTFSDLTFLRRVHARALPRTRLQQWLLVAARCLILALLVTAFAGPVIQAGGDAAAATGEGLDLVVLADVSYSMGYREAGKTRFELGRAETASLLRTLKASDRVAVIAFSDRLESSEPPRWLTPREAAEALGRLEPGFRATDYGPAFAAAAELLGRDARRRRAALLLGDGAAHGLRGQPPSLGAGVPFLGLTFPASPNAALLHAGPARGSDASRPTLAVRAAGVQGRASVELAADGRRWQAASLKGPGQAAGTAALPSAPPGAEAAWSGQASLRADALAADDAYHYSFRHPSRPKVLVLYGDPGFFKAPAAGFFLKELLGGAEDSLLPFEADYLELSRLGEARLSDYRLAVVAGASGVSAAAAAELDRFVKRGGGLLAVPGARAGGDGLAGLDALLPGHLGPLVEGDAAGLAPGPASDARFWKGFDLGKVVVSRYHLLSPRPGARVLFKSSSGYPLLVVGQRGQGRVALWASTLDAAWTNLPLKPPFAAWLQSTLEALSPESERRSQTLDLKVGQRLSRSWAENEAAPASVRLRGPDGQTRTLWVQGRAVDFADTADPGLYTMTEEGTGRRTVFAVNADRSTGESELTPASPSPWTPVTLDQLAAQFRLKVYGRDARSAALAAAAVCLAVEMALALPRRAVALVLLSLLLGAPARAQQGDRFAWTQLDLGPASDPYPTAHSEILSLFGTVTSVLTTPERRFIGTRDPALYYSPLILVAGRQAPADLDDEEARRLRNYLTAGGLLWIEDVSGAAESAFDRWVRRNLPRVLPEAPLEPLGGDHVVYRTFFLLRAPAGRVMVRGSLEGVTWAGRTAVIYSRNDLLGVWLKDALGKPLYPCLPGGEPQRHNARKLVLNILMYALTGSYKADAVHQPYLLQKMRSGAP